MDGIKLHRWSCTRRTRGTFYGGSWGKISYFLASFSSLITHCLVRWVSLLWPFQGFLYVFGGMLDSAYTNRRCPLWVFDIGEFHCEGVCRSNCVILAGHVRILSANASAWQTKPVVACRLQPPRTCEGIQSQSSAVCGVCGSFQKRPEIMCFSDQTLSKNAIF